MTKKPRIEELEDISVYEKVLTLSYGNLAPFVIGNMFKPRLPVMLTWATVVSALFLSVWFFPGLRYASDDPQIIMGLAAGLIIVPVLLIPVHEGAHLIPFRLCGARDIRIGADLRQGIIFVTAHRFVAGQRLFAFVALTPFIAVTAGLLFLMALSGPWWQWVLSMAILVHATMCAGDTALLGFINSYGNRRVYTWDDADKREAYFYVSK
jgi:hypothetical protein